MKTCYDVNVVEPMCIDGYCFTPDAATSYPKCFPVDYDSACHETSANGPAVSCGPYYCDVPWGQTGRARRNCASEYRFNPCDGATVLGSLDR